jgi:hypothetical protein
LRGAGVRHEIFNPGTDEALFLSFHAPHEGYDFVTAEFRHIAAALRDREYDSSQRSVSLDAPL